MSHCRSFILILSLLGHVMAAIYDFDLVTGIHGTSVIANETERELVLKCIENNITDIGIVKWSEDMITIYLAKVTNETDQMTDYFMDCFEDTAIDTEKYGFTYAYGLVRDEETLDIATQLMGSEAVAEQQEKNRYWTEYYETNPHLLSLYGTEPVLDRGAWQFLDQFSVWPLSALGVLPFSVVPLSCH